MSNHTEIPQPPETPKLSKAESARRNGALSTGPKTELGMVNSANARLKHGAYSKRVLMDGESPEGYDAFKFAFVDLFVPVDAFETECVDAMVTTRWRIRRLEAAETSNLNITLDSNKQKLEETYDGISPLQERSIAVQGQISHIDSNTRVQERLYRIYERNFKLLASYRQKCGRKMPDSLPSDPLVNAANIPQPAAEIPVADPPASDAANLTDDPKTNTASSPVGSLIAKIAMFLVVFSSLFLAPVSCFSKSTQYVAPSSAFYAPAAPANSARTVK